MEVSDLLSLDSLLAQLGDDAHVGTGDFVNMPPGITHYLYD